MWTKYVKQQYNITVVLSVIIWPGIIQIRRGKPAQPPFCRYSYTHSKVHYSLRSVQFIV